MRVAIGTIGVLLVIKAPARAQSPLPGLDEIKAAAADADKGLCRAISNLPT